ncbi:MAG: anaerobic C4-dicarboxylate transporter [Bacteroidales bacterium]|nr:anaerobic C4-dicarboxylate transporter [Bacteroidales bacterium]MBR4568961.1 anaerobic C4-dicarboxylate transporter [Bacteroidales bacterium]
MVLMIIQLLIVLAALYVGSRYGSLALGAISGIGLAILVFGFGMTPGTPPTDVIYIIIAAVTCAAVLQAAGGMDWLIQIAERALRKHPDHITFYAPICTFLLTVLVGTGHVVYTLMPLIADIALKKGIRPERPCAVASIASQVGITCSPIAAAVVAFTTISAANGFDITIPQVLIVTIPACLVGLLAAAACSYRRGKDLDKDPEFQARLQDPEMYKYMYGENATLLDKVVSKEAKASVMIFLAAILAIVILAACGYKTVKMNLVIQIIMLVAAGLMIILCKAKPAVATSGKVFQSGMVAVIAIFGIAWMADTYFSNYMDLIQNSLGGLVGKYPWAIAFVFFLVSVLINSQGAVVVAMLPLAYSLGIPGPILLGVLPSVYGYFFIPNYPSDIATVNFDRSGTTKIGKYLLNHSFMMPGLVSVIVSTLVAMLISSLIY